MKLEKFCGGKIYIDITESPTMQGFKLCSWQYKQRQILGDLASHVDTFVDISGDQKEIHPKMRKNEKQFSQNEIKLKTIGACLGYFTLFMAKKMNDKGRILSFEPYPNDYNQGFNIYSICHNLQPISQILDPNTIGEILVKKE